MRKMPRKNTKERRSRVISDESAQSSDDARAQLDKLLDAEQRVLQRIQKLEEREKLLLESCKQLKTNSEPRQRKGNRNRLKMQDITNVSITVRRDNVVLTDLIGAGGTGARVYNCVIDDAWTCVVKEIDGNICAPEHVEEVKEEIELMASLPQHINLVRYLFHYELNNIVRLFMMRYSTNLEKVISERVARAEEDLDRKKEMKFVDGERKTSIGDDLSVAEDMRDPIDTDRRMQLLHKMPSYRLSASSAGLKKHNSAAPTKSSNCPSAAFFSLRRQSLTGQTSKREQLLRTPSYRTSMRHVSVKINDRTGNDDDDGDEKKNDRAADDDDEDDDDDYDEVEDQDMFEFESEELVPEALLKRSATMSAGESVTSSMLSSSSPTSTASESTDTSPPKERPKVIPMSKSTSSISRDDLKRDYERPSSDDSAHKRPKKVKSHPNVKTFSISNPSAEAHKYDAHLFSYETLLLYALCIAKGLEQLHAVGICYRDLKPENVLVTLDEAESPVHVAIGDFGAATRVTGSKGPCETIGTIGYMAPEVLAAQDEHEYGLSADVYSFGMLLYEMMTFEHPFADIERPADMFPLIRNGQLPRLCDATLYKYRGVADLYYQCTQLDPGSRPMISLVAERLEEYFRVSYMEMDENVLAQRMLSSAPAPMAFSPRGSDVMSTPRTPVARSPMLTGFGWTEMHACAADEDLDVLERLLEDSSLNFAAKNQDGNIPLHYFVLASKWGSDVERYEKLLDRMLAACDINDANKHGETALHRCVMRNKFLPMKALIERGADVNARTTRGLSPLHFAATLSSVKCCEALLDAGSRPDDSEQGISSIESLAATSTVKDQILALIRDRLVDN